MRTFKTFCIGLVMMLYLPICLAALLVSAVLGIIFAFGGDLELAEKIIPIPFLPYKYIIKIRNK